MKTSSSIISHLVAREVRRIVAEARSRSCVLSAPESAKQILASYPNCGLESAHIANQVMMAAARAGVAVEIGPQEGKAKKDLAGRAIHEARTKTAAHQPGALRRAGERKPDGTRRPSHVGA